MALLIYLANAEFLLCQAMCQTLEIEHSLKDLSCTDGEKENRKLENSSKKYSSSENSNVKSEMTVMNRVEMGTQDIEESKNTSLRK